MNICEYIINKKNNQQKLFALLIDPDKTLPNDLIHYAKQAQLANVDLIFVGGSFLTVNNIQTCVSIIKENCNIPVLLFPGSAIQITNNADGILFISLISGRNADLLIGQHVQAAPMLKQTNLEIISTGYILVESGKLTTATYISNSFPIPADKDDLSAATALAGEYLGNKLIYLDCGSGSKQTVSESMVKLVSNTISIPLIVGGGIKTPEQANLLAKAGADIIVIGTAIEKNLSVIYDFSNAIHSI